MGFGAVAFGLNALRAAWWGTLPFPDSGQLVTVQVRTSPAGRWQNAVPKQALELFEPVPPWVTAIGSAVAFARTIRIDGVNRRAVVAAVHDAFFELFEISAARGRALRSSSPSEPAAVVSYQLWQRYFASAGATLDGAILQIDGVTYHIVGVMPKRFDYPTSAEVWVPAMTSPVWPQLTCCITVLLRLHAGVTARSASDMLRSITPVAAGRETGLDPDFRVRPFLDDFADNPVRSLSTLELSILGGLLLLTIASALLLLHGRDIARAPEFAIRSALGASPMRNYWTKCVDVAILGIAGGALALGVAAGSSLLLVRLVGARMPLWLPVNIGWPLVGICVGLTVVLCGAYCAVTAIHGAIGLPWRSLSSMHNAGTVTLDLRMATRLVTAQIAVAVAFSCPAAVLSLHLLGRLHASGVVDTKGLYEAEVHGRQESPHTAQIPAFLAAVATAGVDLSAAHTRIILGANTIRIDRGVRTFGTQDVRRAPRLISADRAYIQRLGIRIRRGHGFTRDRTAGEALLSEEGVREFFSGKPVLGHLITIVPTDTTRQSLTARVVGITGDVRLNSWAFRQPPPVIIVRAPPDSFSSFQVYFRAKSGVEASEAVASLRSAVPAWTIDAPRAVEALHRQQLWPLWVPVLVFAPLGALTLVVAVVSVGGLVHLVIMKRAKEFAVRQALGATNRRLIVDLAGWLALIAFVAEAVGMIASMILIEGVGRLTVTTFTAFALESFAISAVLTVSALIAGALVAARPLVRLQPAALLRR